MINTFKALEHACAVPASSRRCRHEIVASILEYLSSAGRARLSRIALYTNMPLDRARLLLGELQYYGLIESLDDGGVRYYRVTEKGFEYLELWRKLKLLSG